MKDPKTILVRSPNWIGDQVMAYRFFEELRAQFPKSKIVVVCVEWVAGIQFRSFVDDVVAYKTDPTWGTWKRFQALESLARKLRASAPDGAWDVGISLPDSISAAYLLWRAGAKQRIGYVGEGRRLLLTDCVDSTRLTEAVKEHRSLRYLRLAKPVGFDPSFSELRGVFDPQGQWNTPALEPPSAPYWVMAPASRAVSRTWPLNYWIELAELVHQETGLQAIVVGGQADQPLGQELEGALPHAVLNWTGRGQVAALWRLLRGGRFFVGCESGMAHVSSLMGTPTHIVCGAADPEVTRPIGPGRVRVFTNPVECWPCVRNSCIQIGNRHIECLKGIAPSRVFSELMEGRISELGATQASL